MSLVLKFATLSLVAFVVLGVVLAQRLRTVIQKEKLSDATQSTQMVARLGIEPHVTVGELTRALPVSQPAVSQHLKVLKEVGMVTDRADGTRRRYRLNEHGVAALRDQLDTFWRRTLEGFEKHMDQEDQQ